MLTAHCVLNSDASKTDEQKLCEAHQLAGVHLIFGRKER